MQLKNVNPLGAVDLPLIGREGDNGTYGEPDERGYAVRTPVPGSGCLEAGEVFEVSDEIGKALLEQVGNYEPATKTEAKAASVAADKAALAADKAALAAEEAVTA